jgi:hypothetical protein
MDLGSSCCLTCLALSGPAERSSLAGNQLGCGGPKRSRSMLQSPFFVSNLEPTNDDGEG